MAAKRLHSGERKSGDFMLMYLLEGVWKVIDWFVILGV
jgi:hypothetical protein